MNTYMSSYTLTSVKAIAFYEKNPTLDFNNVNELFVDLIQNITNTIQDSISVNEVKALLHTIHKKVDTLEHSTSQGNKLLQMTYDHIGEQKQYYVQQMKEVLQNGKKDVDILALIRETNNTFLEKTTFSILQQFPKLTNEFKNVQKDMFQESHGMIQKITNQQRGGDDPASMEKVIQHQYEQMTNKVMGTLQTFYSQESMFYQTNMDLKRFLEKQKNSTKKGKESENKLEACLTQCFPGGKIVDKSGEPKACDYLLQRQDKCDILFENKDYQSNVPNEEIKKFIRDIEYQEKHGIMISQHSGIQNKTNFQIDIHMNHIMVFIHFGNYEHEKLNMAVALIDHLDKALQKNASNDGDAYISIDQLSGINKEYLQFIGQKKQLMETYKKQHKDHLKQLEDFEMPQLTMLLNSLFTNVDQLSFKCTLCNQFNAKNKRALITHQNKCKKLMAQTTNLNDNA